MECFYKFGNVADKQRSGSLWSNTDPDHIIMKLAHKNQHKILCNMVQYLLHLLYAFWNYTINTSSFRTYVSARNPPDNHNRWEGFLIEFYDILPYLIFYSEIKKFFIQVE
jgi:hypothetical protein